MLFVESRSRKKPFGNRGEPGVGGSLTPARRKADLGSANVNRRLPACEAQSSAQRSTAPTASPVNGADCCDARRQHSQRKLPRLVIPSSDTRLSANLATCQSINTSTLNFLTGRFHLLDGSVCIRWLSACEDAARSKRPRLKLQQAEAFRPFRLPPIFFSVTTYLSTPSSPPIPQDASIALCPRARGRRRRYRIDTGPCVLLSLVRPFALSASRLEWS